MIDNENWSTLLNRPEIEIDRQILASAVEKRRVLIVGAGGSIGTSLSRFVATLGPEQLILLDNHEASLVRLGRGLGNSPNGVDVRYQLGDLRDRRKIDQIFRRSAVDVVFHLAACKQVPLAEDIVDQVIQVNLVGTMAIVEAAIEYGADTIVYPSSDKAVNPASVYAASKRVAERALQALAQERHRPAIRVVRLVNVFGTQGSVVEFFVRQIQGGQPLTITDPRMDRYWMTMHEARQLLLAAATRSTFEGFNMLDVGDPVLTIDLARNVYALLHPDGGEPAMIEIGSRPGERLHEDLSLPGEQTRPTDLPGLLAIETPPSSIDAETWMREFHRLAEWGYEWEPRALKDRLFALATCATIEEADALAPSIG